MIDFKEYLLENGTPSLKECLQNNWFPNISYDYRLNYTCILTQPERIRNEIEYLTGDYEEELDFERGVTGD